MHQQCHQCPIGSFLYLYAHYAPRLQPLQSLLDIGSVWVLEMSTLWVKWGTKPNRFANMVFPEPGGPIKIILCPPAAAIYMQRFIDSCPFTLITSFIESTP